MTLNDLLALNFKTTRVKPIAINRNNAANVKSKEKSKHFKIIVSYLLYFFLCIHYNSD